MSPAPRSPDAGPCAWLARLALGLAALALLGLVGVQGWQVAARYGLNASPGWTEPVALLLLSTAMSFGAAAGVHGGNHFSFRLLSQAAAPGLRRVLDSVSHAVVIAIGATLCYWSTRLLLDGLDVAMAGAPVPQSLPFAPLALGSGLMALFAAQQLWREWRPRAGGEPR
jgi:TRAP-type C4-dicarboxylate transport system permease small subunit